MAVKLGRTKDGLDLDAMPELKGVTCFFCHNTATALDLSPDLALGAAIRGPIADHRSHDARYVSFLDGTQDNSPALCGACHDIVTPGGAAIERTFAEWGKSRFGVGERLKKSCAACHMPGRDGRAAEVDGAPPRTQHDHMMVGVDLALTDFPERDAQHAATQKMLDDAVDARLCVTATSIDVALTNRAVGHGWPSGSNQDRRAWIELTAFAGDRVVFESGKVPAESAVSKTLDPLVAFVLRDHVFDAAGAETELFWRAATFTSAQLPAATTSDPNAAGFDNSVHKVFTVTEAPDRVTMQVNIRPVDHDLVDELVSSGDLDPAALAPVTTFTLAKTKLEWTSASAGCVGQ